MFISRFYNVLATLTAPYIGSPATRITLQRSEHAEVQRQYYLVELPLSSATTMNAVAISGVNYKIVKHHISIDREHESPGREKHLSTYHYTATLHNAAGEEFILHVYFNCDQTTAQVPPTFKFRDTLIHLTPAEQSILKEIANLYTQPFMLWLLEKQKNILKNYQTELLGIDAQIKALPVASIPQNRAQYQDLLGKKIVLLKKMQPFAYEIDPREITTLEAQYHALTNTIAAIAEQERLKAQQTKVTSQQKHIRVPAIAEPAIAEKVSNPWALQSAALIERIVAVPVKVTNERDVLTAQDTLECILSEISKLPSQYFDPPFTQYIDRIILLQDNLSAYKNGLIRVYGGFLLSSAAKDSPLIRSGLAQRIGDIPATLLTDALIKDDVNALAKLLDDFKPDLDASTINLNGQDLPLIAYCLTEKKTKCFKLLVSKGASLLTKVQYGATSQTLYLSILTESQYFDELLTLLEINPVLFTKDFMLKVLDMAKSDLESVSQALERAQAQQKLQVKTRCRQVMFPTADRASAPIQALQQRKQIFESYTAMMKSVLTFIDTLGWNPADTPSHELTKLLKFSRISDGIGQYINAALRIELNFLIAHMCNNITYPILKLLTPTNLAYVKTKFMEWARGLDSIIGGSAHLSSALLDIGSAAGLSTVVPSSSSAAISSMMSMLSPVVSQIPTLFAKYLTPERVSLINKLLAHPKFTSIVEFLIVELKLAGLLNDFLTAWQQKYEGEATILAFLMLELPRLLAVFQERFSAIFDNDDSKMYKFMAELYPVLLPLYNEFTIISTEFKQLAGSSASLSGSVQAVVSPHSLSPAVPAELMQALQELFLTGDGASAAAAKGPGM